MYSRKYVGDLKKKKEKKSITLPTECIHMQATKLKRTSLPKGGQFSQSHFISDLLLFIFKGVPQTIFKELTKTSK